LPAMRLSHACLPHWRSELAGVFSTKHSETSISLRIRQPDGSPQADPHLSEKPKLALQCFCQLQSCEYVGEDVRPTIPPGYVSTKPARIGRITIEAPAESSVASANSFHFPHGVAKFLRPIRINAISDSNQYRPALRFRPYCCDWFGPVHPGREIYILAVNQPIPNANGEAYQ
jgi:hypothetical protein